MTMLTDAPATTRVRTPSDEEVQLPERRRSTATFRRTDFYAMGGALLAAVCFAGLLFTVVLPWSGPLGFLAVSYVLFLVLYATLVSFDESGPAVRDKIAGVVVHSLAFLMLLTLIFVIAYTLVRGLKPLLNLNFLTDDMSRAGPLDPLDKGGIKHAIVGTLEMITLALLITVPLGVTSAVFLSEIPGRFSRFVRTIAEAMTALPSIIAGLFIYATFILIFGLPKSALAASLAISVMMLPIIIRASDVVLRLVPGNLKEASLAMGAGQWRTVWHVTLPTARSGLATAVILGTARGIGETSPVLLTAGYTASLNTNPTSGPMISLPLATFEFVKSPQQNFIARGFGTAAVLMTLVLILFVIARIIGGKGPGRLSKRQRKRAAAQSARDLARFEAAAVPAVPAGMPASVPGQLPHVPPPVTGPAPPVPPPAVAPGSTAAVTPPPPYDPYAPPNPPTSPPPPAPPQAKHRKKK